MLAEIEFGDENNIDSIKWEEYKKFKEKLGKEADYNYFCKHYSPVDTKLKKVLPENEPILDLIFKYLGIYYDGMGGISSYGIISTLEIEGVDKRVRGIYITKIISFVSKVLSLQQKSNPTLKGHNNEKHKSRFRCKR